MDEKLQRHRELQEGEQKLKADKQDAAARLGSQMEAWAKTPDGKFKDVRTLISHVHQVIWDDADWTAPSMADLMMNKAAVKKAYRRICVHTHPDKHQNASAEKQFRADRIFNAINEAFKNAKDV